MIFPTFTRSDKYVLFNREKGTALTLADVDGVPGLTVKGLEYGDNQMWQFVKTAQGYAIQCFKRAQDGSPIYVGALGRIGYLTPIVACTAPLSWSVVLYQDRGLYIAWPESEFNIELAWGNSGATDKIALGLRGNQKGIPFDPALWCYSCVGSPAGDLPEPANGEREKSMSRTAQRGGHTFPNTTVHLLTNQAKTVLEADRTSSLVRNRPVQQGVLVENQQWRFIPLGAGCIIESCSKSASGEPLYLAVDGHARSGASVVVSRYPASWRVEYGLSSLRLFWPMTNLVASARSSKTDDCVMLAEYDNGPLSRWDDAVVEDTAVVPKPDPA